MITLPAGDERQSASFNSVTMNDLEDRLRLKVPDSVGHSHHTNRVNQRKFRKFKGTKLPMYPSVGVLVLELIAEELNKIRFNDVKVEKLEYQWSPDEKEHILKVDFQLNELNYKFTLSIFPRSGYHYVDKFIAVSGLIADPTKKGRNDLIDRLFHNIEYEGDASSWPNIKYHSVGSSSGSMLLGEVEQIHFLNEQLKIGKDMEENIDALVEKASRLVESEFREFSPGKNLNSLELHNSYGGVYYEHDSAYTLKSLTPEDLVSFRYVTTLIYTHRDKDGNTVMRFQFEASVDINYSHRDDNSGSRGINVRQEFTNPVIIMYNVHQINVGEILNIAGSCNADVKVDSENDELRIYPPQMTHLPSTASPAGGYNHPMKQYDVLRKVALEIDKYLNRLNQNDSEAVGDFPPIEEVLTPTAEAEQVADGYRL